MPFLTGLAITALAPFQAAQSFAFAADARLDALGWAGLAALAAVLAVLGRAVHRAARAKRRRRMDAKRAVLARRNAARLRLDPRRRWLAPSATYNSTPPAAPATAQARPAEPEPAKSPEGDLRGVPQAQPHHANPPDFAALRGSATPPPKPAYVPASPTFAGGHVLASGLDARVFLRYRDAAGAVTDSIFQIYQVRAAWQGGRIAQLHGHCFTRRAFQAVPMRDVQALGDERTGHFIFDLDAFLLGTPVAPNPFGITLSLRGEHLSDPGLPLLELPANWLEWQSLTDEAAQVAAPQPQAAARARFLLRYVGSDGRASERIVRSTSISLGDDGAILSLSAHCERAGAVRMFRRDRIAGLGDATTGALHDDIDGTLRQSGTPMRRAAAKTKPDGVREMSTGRDVSAGLEEARRAFAAMAPAERLASATRPPEPKPPKEKRPRGRPRKDAVKPDE